jgi:hypothetical protein
MVGKESMMRIPRAFVFVILVTLLTMALSGCVRYVRSNVSVFHDLSPGRTAQPIAILPWDESKRDSLEFRTYAERLAGYLRNNGFNVVDESEKPPLVAFFNYGIDDGKPVVSSYAIPRWGQTGVSSVHTTRTVTKSKNRTTVRSLTTYTPEYGVTGYTTETRTTVVFTRFIDLDIVELGGPDGAERKLYEGRLRSLGGCASMAFVMDALLEAFFTEFPGISGTGRTVDIRWENDC